MPCTITPEGGRAITFQINPTVVDVTNDAEQGSFRAIRGGNYPYQVGYNPESLTLEVELPDNRPTYPNAAAWMDPQEYIHAIQSAIRRAKGRVYVDFPEANVGSWYLCKEVREHYAGGFMDVGLSIQLTEDRRILLLTTADTPAAVAGSPPPDTSKPPPAPGQPGNPGGLADTPQPGFLYAVQDGDSLVAISQIAYGTTDDAHVTALAVANAVDDPTNVATGSTISIPREDEIANPSAAFRSSTADTWVPLVPDPTTGDPNNPNTWAPIIAPTSPTSPNAA